MNNKTTCRLIVKKYNKIEIPGSRPKKLTACERVCDQVRHHGSIHWHFGGTPNTKLTNNQEKCRIIR
jgi:hypothetical protein